MALMLVRNCLLFLSSFPKYMLTFYGCQCLPESLFMLSLSNDADTRHSIHIARQIGSELASSNR